VGDRPGTSEGDNLDLLDLEAARAKKIAGTRVRAVLKMLASEAGFMVNPQVQESLASMPLDDAEVSRAETMLKALGVKTEERLNTLVNYFFVEKKDEVTRFHGDMHDEGQEFEAELALLLKDPPEDIAELREMIRPEDVIAAVKAYIEDMSVEAGPVGVSTAVSGNTKSSQEEIRIAQRRLASMRNYWVQLGQIVHDDTVSVWKQLERDCGNCKDLLGKRAQSIVEVDELTRQNAELKSLLNQYLGDNVTNAAFRVPPAQVGSLCGLFVAVVVARADGFVLHDCKLGDEGAGYRRRNVQHHRWGAHEQQHGGGHRQPAGRQRHARRQRHRAGRFRQAGKQEHRPA
jgi:hypothetical protein